jgi:hypothetical protein
MRGSASLSDAYRLLRQQKVLRGAWDQADVRGSTLLPPLPKVHAGNRLRTRVGNRETSMLFWSTNDSAHWTSNTLPTMRSFNVGYSEQEFGLF